MQLCCRFCESTGLCLQLKQVEDTALCLWGQHRIIVTYERALYAALFVILRINILLYVVTELYICYFIDQFIMFESYEYQYYQYIMSMFVEIYIDSNK